MALSLHFHVLQYIEDPYLAEGRNVAVLAYHGGRGHFRALGVDGYKLTPSHFKSLSSKARDSSWAYREWAEWFHSLSNVREIEQFNEAVNRLESNGAGLVATTEGVVELTDGYGDADEAMDFLFRRLVRAPKISPALAFEDRLEVVLMQSEIAYAENFSDEMVVVEMVSEDGNEVTLEFSHLMTGDRPIGFNTLVMQGVTQRYISRQVQRISSTFRNAVRTEFIRPEHCILLCGKLEDKHQEIIAQLSGVATVLDVFDESTPQRIRRLVWPRS